jgi:hypothetical protein
VIGFLVANTSLRHDDILRLTIPQINLYADKAGMFKIGAFGMVGKGGGKKSNTPPVEESLSADSLDDVMKFAGKFNVMDG